MALDPKLPSAAFKSGPSQVQELGDSITGSQSSSAESPDLGQFLSGDPSIESLPFYQWKAQGPCEQIPWSFHAYLLGMGFAERLVERLEIDVTGGELAARVADGRLVALVELIDGQSKVYRNWGEFKLKRINGDFRRNEVHIYWDAFVTPGNFRVNVALYDTATHEHSFGTRSLSVEPYRKDVLAGSWSGLPSLEFLDPSTGLDEDYRPEISGSLYLPVPDRLQVHLRLILNSAVSRDLTRRPGWGAYYLSNMITSLKTLSEVDVGDGTRDVVVLDLARLRKSFEQTELGPLDWPNLKAALQDTESGVIDVQSLQKRTSQAAFLRDELEDRVVMRGDPATPKKKDSRCVTILVSTYMNFESRREPIAAAVPGNGVCYLYYLRYATFSQTDDVERILKPLHPRVLDIKTPDDLRRAIAMILGDLARQKT